MGAVKVEGLDLRALGLFRVVLGLNVIFNILKYKMGYVHDFLGHEGIIPKDVLKELIHEAPNIFHILPSDGLITLFLIITVVIAFLFTIGFQARITGLLTFICFWNLLQPNPFIIHGPEFLIEVSLAWSIFLPVNHTYSFFPEKHRPQEINIRSIAVYAFIFQLFLIYFSGGITKSGEAWRSGLVIINVLEDSVFTGPIGSWLLDYPAFCTFLTQSTIWIEIGVAFCLINPFFNRTSRLFAAVVIFVLQVLFALALNVGAFHLITTAFAIVLIPTSVWDKLGVPRDMNFRPIASAVARAPQPILKWSVNAFIILLSLFVLQQNTKMWEKNSYLEDALSDNFFNDIPAPSFGVSGLLQQPWYFFAPDPPREKGTLMLLVRSKSGEITDALTDKVVEFQINPETGQQELKEVPRWIFGDTRSIFTSYIRRYYETIPPQIIANWSDYELKRWQGNHPDVEIMESRMMLYSRQTQVVAGEIIEERKILQLYSVPL